MSGNLEITTRKFFLIPWKRLLLYYVVSGIIQNYLVFQNKKNKPANIINQAMNTFQDTMLYMKCTNWIAPPSDWFKWKTNAFRIESQKSSTMTILCRDDQGRTRFKSAELIGNCHTFLTETLAINEAVMETIKARLNKVSVKSDSKVAIQAIMGKISPPSDIFNIVTDRRVLTSVVIDIQFLCCNRKANTLVDYLANEANRCTIYPIWIINNIQILHCVKEKGILLLKKSKLSLSSL